MNLLRTQLLERGELTTAGDPKRRTREAAPLSPTRRDLYSRVERRLRDQVTTARRTAPALYQRRAQRQFGERLKRTPLRHRVIGRLR